MKTYSCGRGLGQSSVNFGGSLLLPAENLILMTESFSGMKTKVVQHLYIFERASQWMDKRKSFAFPRQYKNFFTRRINALVSRN